MTPIESGQTAAALDLELRDAEGTPHTLSAELAKGAVLLVLYKSSCQASKTMLPMLERIHQRYGASGLTVLGLAQDSANITRSFMRRYGITFPILIDTDDYAMSRAFDIFATPTVYLIQPDGNVAETLMGFMQPQVNELADTIAAELGMPPQSPIIGVEPDIPMFVPG